MAESITTTYAGEFAGKYISAALLSANTLENGGIEIRPNVKFKEVVKTLSTNDLVKDASCDFSDQSTVTLAERILQPEEFEVNLELCKTPFASDWEAIQMGYSAFDNLPPAFSDYLIGYVAAKVAQKMENNIWQGVNATTGEFDGFETLWTADASVVDVTGTTVTAANVIDEMGKVVDAISTEVYGKEDLMLYVSSNVARAYIRALGGFGASGLGANGVNAEGTTWFNNGSLSFDGIPIFVANGMSNDTMAAACKSNLYFGTGLMSDMNEVKVLDMGDLDGSQNVRVIMRFTAGIQYGIPADIVYYS